ncbi:GATA transcription factor 1 isoform X1 [Ziziphus jujuba]|uniref:GATA transcription factor 1 isoform X1 n=1 Tax=Ziziphus jujuba TaxID=326968 RepID=A0ABM3IRM8_ZIZJJ|nr:GATA transcription factor 1 isoform X1 [Ziziphus jujuba]
MTKMTNPEKPYYHLLLLLPPRLRSLMGFWVRMILAVRSMSLGRVNSGEVVRVKGGWHFRRMRTVFDTGATKGECAEEELEWISNKDLFPALESFVDILSDHQVGIPKHQSPVSVLDSSTTSSNSNNSNSNSHSHSTNSNSNTTLISSCGSLKAPRRARSKRRCRRRRATFADLLGRQLLWTSTNSSRNTNANANGIVKVDAAMTGTTTIGRKCLHCGAEKTPQWRAGPLGPKTLCNACGVRYKSGRLAPEYRPASSPTFSNDKHSNSHRKVMEMRRVKQMMGVGVKPLGTG